MLIPDSLRQSMKPDGKALSKPKNVDESQGSIPVAQIFNDKDQTEDNTYGVRDSKTIKNDSMLFDSVQGGNGPSVDLSTQKSGNCLMSLCGTTDKQSILMSTFTEGSSGKPKIRNTNVRQN